MRIVCWWQSDAAPSPAVSSRPSQLRQQPAVVSHLHSTARSQPQFASFVDYEDSEEGSVSDSDGPGYGASYPFMPTQRYYDSEARPAVSSHLLARYPPLSDDVGEEKESADMDAGSDSAIVLASASVSFLAAGAVIATPPAFDCHPVEKVCTIGWAKCLRLLLRIVSTCR